MSSCAPSHPSTSPHLLPWNSTSKVKVLALNPLLKALFSREFKQLVAGSALPASANVEQEDRQHCMGLGEWRGDKDDATFIRLFPFNSSPSFTRLSQ